MKVSIWTEKICSLPQMSLIFARWVVITSYSIHYTKLYDWTNAKVAIDWIDSETLTPENVDSILSSA